MDEQQTQLKRTNLHPQSSHYPWLSLFKNSRFQLTLMALIGIFLQNVIWWVYPLIYGQHLNAQLPLDLQFLLGYTISLALAIFLMLYHQFHSIGALLILAINVLFTFSNLIKGDILVFTALLSFTFFLVALQFKWFKLRSIWGLITFALANAFIIPLTVFYLQNKYVTQPFILTLFPLFLCYLYFMTPLFIVNITKKRLTSLGLGILLIITLLTLSINFWTICAIAIVISTWLILINLKLSYAKLVPLLLAIQAVTVLILFLQQY